MILRAEEPGGLAALWQWFTARPELLWWMFALSMASLVVSALLLPVIVTRLPFDYFTAARTQLARRRGPWQWVLRVLRNLFGVVFVLAGLIMIPLPGQGVLTLLIGILMTDFPGKRALELRMVRNQRLLGFLDRMRERRGKPPFRVD